MLERKLIFPNVLELNFQAGRVLGCNVYLVFDGREWILIDIGYQETVEEFVELIRQLDGVLIPVEVATLVCVFCLNPLFFYVCTS